MLIYSSAILSLLTTPTNNPAKYNANRAVNIVKELAERSVGVLPTSGGSNGNNAELKSEILSQLAPFGDPALNVPTTAFDDVNELCRKLEKRNPSSSQKAAIEALQGTWKLRSQVFRSTSISDTRNFWQQTVGHCRIRQWCSSFTVSHAAKFLV